MKKALMMIALITTTMMFTACDTDDDWYYGGPECEDNRGDQGGGNNDNYGSQLNTYEQGLVGSYVSDDENTKTYITLNNDRSGTIQSGDTSSGFTWRATSSKLIVIYDNENTEYGMNYYYKNNHLYIDGIPLVSNTGGSGTETTQSALIGQWQGSVTGYYLNMYPNLDSNGTYATILEFAEDGFGAQLDYDESNPRGNYSYMPFQWMSNNTAIILYYGNDIPTATISNYALTSTKFTGQVAYGVESYAFKYDKTSGFDWTPYKGVKASTTKNSAHTLIKELIASKSKATTCGTFKK